MKPAVVSLALVFSSAFCLLPSAFQATPGRVEVLKSASGLPAHVVGLFRDPIGFKQTANGDYYVFDRRGHTVYAVDAAGGTAQKLVQIGAEDGRLIEPSAFDVAVNGSFAVADAPNGRERVQIFDAAGVRTGGFILPGRGASRVVLGSLSLNGVGTLAFTGRTLMMSHPESGWLMTEYALDGSAIRSIGQLRRTGHESDRDLHLAWNAGIPIADPTGGFVFVFMAGAPAFRKYDAKGELIYERVIQGREIDPLIAAIPDRGCRSLRQAVGVVRIAGLVCLRPGRREGPYRAVPRRRRARAGQPLVQRKGPPAGHTGVLRIQPRGVMT
jgi:hypothetical protein